VTYRNQLAGLARAEVARAAGHFLESAQQYRELKTKLGSRRARLFWDVQEAVLATTCAAYRREIEAVQDTSDYEAILADILALCEEGIRDHQEIQDAFEQDPQTLDLALTWMRRQLPPFLETRLGQTHRLVPA
jgi:hypothetical protein